MEGRVLRKISKIGSKKLEYETPELELARSRGRSNEKGLSVVIKCKYVSLILPSYPTNSIKSGKQNFCFKQFT